MQENKYLLPADRNHAKKGSTSQIFLYHISFSFFMKKKILISNLFCFLHEPVERSQLAINLRELPHQRNEYPSNIQVLDARICWVMQIMQMHVKSTLQNALNLTQKNERLNMVNSTITVTTAREVKPLYHFMFLSWFSNLIYLFLSLFDSRQFVG